MAEDHQGNLWINFGKETAVLRRQAAGSYRVDRATLARIADTPPYDLHLDPDGVVWLAMGETITRYDPARAVQSPAVYPAIVRRVIAGEDSVLFGGALPAGTERQAVLRYAQNTLRFQYAATSFVNPAKTRYRSMLEGFDEHWSAWSEETKRDYTNLPPGRYRFRAQAKNIYGQKSTEAAYTFTILPPWYRTWWAYGIYTVLAALILFTADRVQRRRLLERARERVERERQAHELEQARRLQLAMLPQTVPAMPGAELAASMLPATEVGGDFYDFEYQPGGGDGMDARDGTLNIVIGDGTGHGAEAGVVVAATKGILSALPFDGDLSRVLERSNRAMRRLHFRKLYMALAIARLNGHVLELSGAGMPPALIHRAAAGTVERVVLNGLPLGGPEGFSYRTMRVVLAPGDTVLLMSDGFPELFDPRGEMLGYERATAIFGEVAGKPPEEIIGHCLRAAVQWTEGAPQHDDMTFLALRVRDTAGK